ncbi:TPA: EAL domain-containing protein [Enterobacter mori]|uniref:EAL domain-containing protein n=1 Tax=Enterobacteriaceae TaxID=543 RepID=UPI0018875C24|nr:MULTISPECIES: EAL domain-containing protein [Enterobacteriaceae]MBF2792906.1 EAL domain-containing protein [Enterobacter asburiae]MDX7584493.1 EAL domain-containing protein [Klebsiella pneumoniae]CAH8250143.1 Uncharacterised protein [Enterobacter mori]CAH8250272.1 Uncharacterised protein [Enterobacter mori]HDR2836375.1 EAL domain-containing protein [Enterobacter mori]
MQTNIFALHQQDLNLRVIAFGKLWELTPVIEPIWNIDYCLKGIELLTRVQECNDEHFYPPCEFFSSITQPELTRILTWQLELLALLRPWCEMKKVLVSLNLIRIQALVLMSRTDLAEQVINLSPWLRIEISEDFVAPGGVRAPDPVLDAIHLLAPLWMDDFGAGATGLTWLTKSRFEVVKLDRGLFSKLATLPEGISFMSGLSALANAMGVKIVAEGVSDNSLMAVVKETRADACQGFLWPAIPLREIGSLPVRMPQVRVGNS